MLTDSEKRFFESQTIEQQNADIMAELVHLREISQGKTPILITGTTLFDTGPYYSITVVDEAVFETLTGMGGDSIAAVAFPTGLTLFGNFTAIKLVSGSVIAYKVEA